METKPNLCEHCNTYHTIYEEYAKCQEARYFGLTLDKWAQDWDNEATDLEIQRRLNEWVRDYR